MRGGVFFSSDIPMIDGYRAVDHADLYPALLKGHIAKAGVRRDKGHKIPHSTVDVTSAGGGVVTDAGQGPEEGVGETGPGVPVATPVLVEGLRTVPS